MAKKKESKKSERSKKEFATYFTPRETRGQLDSLAEKAKKMLRGR